LTGLDITNKLVYQANVFSRAVRTLAWEEAMTVVQPDDLSSRRHKQQA
jgi:serine/threonine protein phosphatase 1